MGGIIERRGDALLNPGLRGELVRALRIRPQIGSSDWFVQAMKIVAAYIDASESIDGVEYWATVVRQLRSDYQVVGG